METGQPATAKETAPRRIILLPDDGIGPETTDACQGLTVDVFPHWELTETQIGWSQWRAHGNPVPQGTWETLGRSDAALFAAITSKPVHEAKKELAPHLRDTSLNYRSPALQLCQRLDLFANIRPITLPDAIADFIVVRENTEGLYNHDYLLPSHDVPTDFPYHRLWAEVVEDSTVARAVDKRGEVAVSLHVTASFAWHHLARQAAKLTLARQTANPNSEVTPTVTVADKPNILQDSACTIRGAVEEVAEEYPQVTFGFADADAVAIQLVTDPARFDVIIAKNLIGDIPSDIDAGLIGGLGLAASANIDDNFAVFEPVHGSTPDIAERSITNSATFLPSTAMCTGRLGAPVSELASATKLYEAVYATTRTAPALDLGGTATTSEFMAVVRAEPGLQTLARLRNTIEVVAINPSRWPPADRESADD